MKTYKIPIMKIQDTLIDIEKWLKNMLTLGAGSYEEKRKIYQEHEDAGLDPAKAKKQYRQDKEDDVWVDGMLALGGQEKE